MEQEKRRNAKTRAMIPWLLALCMVVLLIPGLNVAAHAAEPSITYSGYFQGSWSSPVSDGAVVGTTGQSTPLESIKIALADASGVSYRTFCKETGWSSWVEDGAQSGIAGQSRQIEAVQIRLTGTLASQYNIYYRAHIQDNGWLAWTSNGAPAGSSGYSRRLEALQIQLVPKVTYRAHVQNIGWRSWVSDDQMSGTTGQGLRMEALQLNFVSPDVDGSLQYRAHVSSNGWLSWVKDGATGGTTGQGRQMEAVQIKLAGNAALKYDVYYAAHVASTGWLPRVKNGSTGGTTGQGRQMEAVKIKLAPKGADITGVAYYEGITRRALVVSAPYDGGAVTAVSHAIMTNLFQNTSFDGNAIQTTSLTDATPQKLENAIQTAFGAATDTDISYIYIHCHGSSTGYLAIGGVSGSYIHMSELRRMLDTVKGTKVLLLESCHSGNAINLGPENFEGDDLDSNLMAEQLLQGFLYPDGISDESGEFLDANYKVICACSKTESAWAYSGSYGWATYSYGLGGGWDGPANKPCALLADSNQDNSVTLQELYTFSKAKVDELARPYSYVNQTVVCWPQDDTTVLFKR